MESNASNLFEIESNQSFSKSKIWQLNRDFYQFRGISAFSENIVPHHLTSNAFVGKAYAELIFGLLKDLGVKGKTTETVYILELGTGHGRLAFHILMHLLNLTKETKLKIPAFCYVLSDIVEENLNFFEAHSQFKVFFEQGILDVSYFDAVGSKELYLRKAKKSIEAQSLEQPIVAIANYFFDSIPTELFLIKDKVVSDVSISIAASEDPATLNPETLIEQITLTYEHTLTENPYYDNPVINEILESYKDILSHSYLFFPEQCMHCIKNIEQLSKEGLLMLSMDKGFHEVHDMDNKKEPDVVTHGSFSIWVNYHALGVFCEKQGGKVLFPTYSTFHLELGAFLLLKNADSYAHTIDAYQKSVDDFGPDDFNSLKHLSYFNVSRLKVKELIALFRLSAYDSTYFIKLLPRLKQVAKAISFNERKRIGETLHKVWESYFSIGEDYDLAYEIGGVFYDLGFYAEALLYFKHSEKLHGQKPDTFYNLALSYYQLRQDKLFFQTINQAKAAFPAFEQWAALDKLDVS